MCRVPGSEDLILLQMVQILWDGRWFGIGIWTGREIKRIDLKEFYLCNFYYFQGPVMRKFTGVLSVIEGIEDVKYFVKLSRRLGYVLTVELVG